MRINRCYCTDPVFFYFVLEMSGIEFEMTNKARYMEVESSNKKT